MRLNRLEILSSEIRRQLRQLLGFHVAFGRSAVLNVGDFMEGQDRGVESTVMGSTYMKREADIGTPQAPLINRTIQVSNIN